MVNSMMLPINLTKLLGLPKDAVIDQVLTAVSSDANWREPSTSCKPRVVRSRRIRHRAVSEHALKELSGLGGAWSSASIVNDFGMIAGNSAPNGRGPSVACAWHGEKLYQIGTLGGIASGVAGISNLGVVVGMSRDEDDVDTAFRWEIDSGIRRIFGKSEFITAARSINDDGVVVGMCRPKSDRSLYADGMRAFVTGVDEKILCGPKFGDCSCDALKINAD
jgi:probable HAF family extracellular repeat protein